MQKKILASLVATLAVGATCAFAANPFVDVPTDSWAYKSVVELADAGVIQGVDGSYFQGERNITRYEAAEMVAKAMAHMDKANLEQRATINKLANEYADELNSLGVRVSNLEKKVGNVKMTGDLRVRYVHIKDGFTGDAGQDKSDSFTYRARLRANAYINDSTTAQVGYSTNNRSFDNSTAGPYQQNDTAGTYNDDAWVQHYFGKNFNVKVGRWDTYQMGDGYGYQYGDLFDGIQAQYNNGKIALTAGYGKFKADSGEVIGGENHELNNVVTGFGEIEGFFKNGALGAYYNNFSGRAALGTGYDAADTVYAPKDIFGVYGKANFGKNWNLLVDYQKVKQADESIFDDANVWAAQLTYGNADYSKVGSWDAWLDYINADAGALYGSTNSWRWNQFLDNTKSFGVGVDYVWAKNAKFSVMQTFASSVKDDTYGSDPDEMTRAQFMFVF